VLDGVASELYCEEVELQRSRRGGSSQAAFKFEPDGDGYLLNGERLDLVEGEEPLDLRFEGLGLKKGRSRMGRREGERKERNVGLSEIFGSRGRGEEDLPAWRREEEEASRPGDGCPCREEGRKARGKRARLKRDLGGLREGERVTEAEDVLLCFDRKVRKNLNKRRE